MEGGGSQTCLIESLKRKIITKEIISKFNAAAWNWILAKKSGKILNFDSHMEKKKLLIRAYLRGKNRD